MRKYGGDINFICLEAQTLKSSSLRDSHCLATIALIVDIHLWCHVLWRFNQNYVDP